MASPAAGLNELPTGTAPTPGVRTPQKTQCPDLSLADPTHALDEHGLDPNAFETLTNALERHRSSSPSAAIHYPPRPLPSIATNPLPVSIQRPQGPLCDSHGSPVAITTCSNTVPSSPITIHTPLRDVPGNYIDPHETAGLPGTNDLEGYARQEANKVVRAHTRRQGFMFGSGRKDKRAKSGTNKAKNSDRNRELKVRDFGSKGEGKFWRADGACMDVERARDVGATSPRVVGGGVLSALLTLYGQETASGMSTPGRSSFDDAQVCRWVRRRPQQEQELAEVEGLEANGDSEREPPRREFIDSLKMPAPSGSENPPSVFLATPVAAQTADDMFESSPITGSLTSLLGLVSRTPQLRNGGSSFRPSIPSTQNVGGTAVSHRQQLDIQRLGYHLSKDSLDSNLPSREIPATTKPMDRSENRQCGLTNSTPGTGSSTPTTSTPPFGSCGYKNKWTEAIRDFPYANSVRNLGSLGRSNKNTSAQTLSPTVEGEDWVDEKWLMDERHREKRRKRKKAEVYITRHVAEIIQRQAFILKLARALMMFGGPSNRLQAQIQSTARVLDVELSCMYLPDVLLISFDDSSTGTSNIKLIRQGSTLDLGKLTDTHLVYWKVIHDQVSVSEASIELDTFMRKPRMYNWKQLTFFGGMCSASICSVSFNGSFLDTLISIPLGSLLIAIQLLSVRNELYSNVFEITVATLFSFISAALASTGRFCYSAIASSSVVLILPGYIVLCGSLEIMSRNIVSGSVRLGYAVVYSLFLGFGLAAGAAAYERISGKSVIGPEDYACAESHDPMGMWYQRTPSMFWAFLTVPAYSLFLSMVNQTPWKRKEMLILVAISCIGWVTNYFTGRKFVDQSDISAAVGAFAVGFVSNLYGRIFSGNAFVVMITGILFQVPSGLGNSGLLTFASEKISGSSTSYLSGFETALQLISVAIGLTVGLGISLVVVHPIQSRRRAGGIFSL